jgi:hypothetical protein
LLTVLSFSFGNAQAVPVLHNLAAPLGVFFMMGAACRVFFKNQQCQGLKRHSQWNKDHPLMLLPRDVWGLILSELPQKDRASLNLLSSCLRDLVGFSLLSVKLGGSLESQKFLLKALSCKKPCFFIKKKLKKDPVWLKEMLLLRDQYGQNLLHYAAKLGNMGLIDFIIKNAKEEAFLVSTQRDAQRQTPYMILRKKHQKKAPFWLRACDKITLHIL